MKDLLKYYAFVSTFCVVAGIVILPFLHLTLTFMLMAEIILVLNIVAVFVLLIRKERNAG